MANGVAPSYEGIKVNIITGFLGAGKTTLIRNLLANMPDNETWAVLVNEFGDIGLDKTFIDSDLSHKSSSHIAVKQVAGGCVCCTTSAAFQVSLNDLIKTYRPDRILIEPTGLGHPRNIFKQLQSPYYQSVLQLENVLCLLDARNLADKRYVNHINFTEQIAVADILVASKAELYDLEEKERLTSYLSREGLLEKPLVISKAGQLDTSFLNKVDGNKAGVKAKTDFAVSHTKSLEESFAYSFDKTVVFEEERIKAWLETLRSNQSVLRVKAIFKLDEQFLLLNASSYDQEYRLSDKGNETGSNVEIIFNTIELSALELEAIKASLDALPRQIS